MATKNSNWRDGLKSSVAVLLGGDSAEREVSLQSGAAVLQALQAENISAVAVDTRDSYWQQEIKNNFQHAFIALHGGDGEDGTVQAVLDTMSVTYTGSGMAASALAMDKLRCKYMWQGMGLSTPAFVELSEQSDWQGIIDEWHTVIVKPVHEGSSLGMAIASTAVELAAAYQAAVAFDHVVMAEKWIKGAEFTVTILGEQSLPAIRLETDNSFYDFEAKYISNETRYICPCELTDNKQAELRELALTAFKSVGSTGWGRVDVMQNELGEFFLLEINTVPGMTSHSLVPMAAEAAGYDFNQLVVEILRLSLPGNGVLMKDGRCA